MFSLSLNAFSCASLGTRATRSSRVYLVGGSGNNTTDPDITLELYSWASPPLLRTEGGKQHHQPCSGTYEHSNAGADGTVAPEPTSATTITLPASTAPGRAPAPTLARMTASQQGEVPSARIGHAAVTLTRPPPSSSSLPSPSRLSSIFLFGGESPTPSTAASTDEGYKSLVYPKLGDVYEGTPQSPSGTTLVWRSLSPPVMQTPREDPADTSGGSGNGGNVGNGGNATATDPDANIDAPAPIAFHASCAALVRGSSSGGGGGSGDCDGDGSSGAEEALLVHGGMDQSLELSADLWAFFPSRISNKIPSEGTGGGGVRGENASSAACNSGGDWATCWERLTPQGEG